jgi:hypothetical protein
MKDELEWMFWVILDNFGRFIQNVSGHPGYNRPSFSSCSYVHQGCQMDFSNQQSQFGKIFRALDWKILMFLWPFGIFVRHFGYFMTIWYILCSIGTFCVHLVHFFRLWYHVPRKIWQPWCTHFLSSSTSALWVNWNRLQPFALNGFKKHTFLHGTYIYV